jgi:hypothetical protein
MGKRCKTGATAESELLRGSTPLDTSLQCSRGSSTGTMARSPGDARADALVCYSSLDHQNVAHIVAFRAKNYTGHAADKTSSRHSLGCGSAGRATLSTGSMRAGLSASESRGST